MIQNMLEKIQLKDEKNLLIQGLPSSIEKQFGKLSFAKNVTPLLRTRKIEFALVFAVNEKQLNTILQDVLPALQANAKMWIAFPKKASKIATDLNKETSWVALEHAGFATVREIELDHVWTAMRYKRTSETLDDEETLTEPNDDDSDDSEVIVEKKTQTKVTAALPIAFGKALLANKGAKAHFDKLPTTHQNEYIDWITSAKKELTQQKRIKDSIDKLVVGKKNPNEK